MRDDPDREGPPDAAAPSEGWQRFQTCRWRAEPDQGSFCTHRDVAPLAGTTAFNPDAWCPDCAFYKLRRNPRRRHTGGNQT